MDEIQKQISLGGEARRIATKSWVVMAWAEASRKAGKGPVERKGEQHPSKARQREKERDRDTETETQKTGHEAMKEGWLVSECLSVGQSVGRWLS